MEYIIFAISLFFLIKAGDIFVDSSINIAKYFHLSEVIIGATIVSIGTTLPELMVSAGGALSGHSDISYGNAIGSIICNTCLVAGLSVSVLPSKVKRESLRIPLYFFIVSVIKSSLPSIQLVFILPYLQSKKKTGYVKRITR